MDVNNVYDIAQQGLEVIGAAAVLATMIPSPNAQKIGGKMATVVAVGRGLLNLVAFNFGFAKNKK